MLSRFFIASCLLLLNACNVLSPSTSHPTLQIHRFSLQSNQVASKEAGMVRGEQLFYLYGAVTPSQKKARIGEYFDFHWQNAPQHKPLILVFEYQQSNSASRIKRQVFTLPKSSLGKASWHCIGSDYQKKGRVSSWRAQLYSGKQLLDEKHSFLWKQ